MLTYDIYCLVPRDAPIGAILDRLFVFEGVVYHCGKISTDIPIRSGGGAQSVANSIMNDGSYIRFHEVKLDHTEGGWLYRLEDSRLAIGICGDDSVPVEHFTSALQILIENSVCCTPGIDEPPPMTAQAFTIMAEKQIKNIKRGGGPFDE